MVLHKAEIFVKQKIYINVFVSEGSYFIFLVSKQA